MLPTRGVSYVNPLEISDPNILCTFLSADVFKGTVADVWSSD